jgi:hypothetical protein
MSGAPEVAGLGRPVPDLSPPEPPAEDPSLCRYFTAADRQGPPNLLEDHEAPAPLMVWMPLRTASSSRATGKGRSAGTAPVAGASIARSAWPWTRSPATPGRWHSPQAGKVTTHSSGKQSRDCFLVLLIAGPAGSDPGWWTDCTVSGDGAFDTRRCHTAVLDRGGAAVMPLRRNGHCWKRTARPPAPATTSFGRALWSGQPDARAWLSRPKPDRGKTARPQIFGGVHAAWPDRSGGPVGLQGPSLHAGWSPCDALSGKSHRSSPSPERRLPQPDRPPAAQKPLVAPSLPAVIERLRRAIFLWKITTAQPPAGEED